MCVAVCCSVLQCAVVYSIHQKAAESRVLQCVAVCCSVLQCAAICCSVLQCVAVCGIPQKAAEPGRDEPCVLRCVAVCCSMLKCVAVIRKLPSQGETGRVRCNMLQCVAARCSVLQSSESWRARARRVTGRHEANSKNSTKPLITTRRAIHQLQNPRSVGRDSFMYAATYLFI